MSSKAERNDKDYTGKIVLQKRDLERDLQEQKLKLMTHRCSLCKEELRTFVRRIPGWIYINYSDGDTFGYCDHHTLSEILNDVIARSDQDIGLYCDVESVDGLECK